MNETHWDVIVLGAGAAGLMAGIRSAECGARTLVLEKNARPGVKILMSGGTRCNLTHDCDNRGIVAAFGTQGKFLHSPLAALGVQNSIDFFESEGVATKVEETGKVFPVSNKASDVLAALLRRLNRSGAELALNEPVVALNRIGTSWCVRTARRTIQSNRVILTTGGKSYPASGTTGDGYAIAASFGHTIVTPRPALTPITTNVPWVGKLRGITLPDVRLTLEGAAVKPIVCRGSLLFAHFGLSGPVALDISRFISGHQHPNQLRLSIDLRPHESAENIDNELKERALTDGKKQLANVLSEHLPHRLAEALLELNNQPIGRKATGLTRPDRLQLAQTTKQLAIPITGTMGFAKAEVTAGGIALDEVDSRTMQSKFANGFFFAGEVLDLDGPIGGFNFQSAWSTGWLAGQSAAMK